MRRTCFGVLVAALMIAKTTSDNPDTQISRKERDISQELLPEYEVLFFPVSKSSTPPIISSRKRDRNKEDDDKKKKKKKKPSKADPSPSLTPCTCSYGVCTCCTGAILDLFQQKACVKINYIPEDFAFDVSMLLNNRVMYKNKVSGKNPPPMCIGLPRFNSLRVCARFSNIYFAGRNMHMCLGMEGRWDYYQLFSISFECIRMGANGIAIISPEEGGGPLGVVGGLDAVIEAGGDDIEEYDENVVRSVSHKKR